MRVTSKRKWPRRSQGRPRDRAVGQMAVVVLFHMLVGSPIYFRQLAGAERRDITKCPPATNQKHRTMDQERAGSGARERNDRIEEQDKVKEERKRARKGITCKMHVKPPTLDHDETRS